MSQAALRDYLQGIEQAYRAGNATEHTYRSNLKALVETLAPGVTATNEPKRVKCGAPDFIITRKQTPSFMNRLLLFRLGRLDLLADFFHILFRLEKCFDMQISRCPALLFLLRRCL